MTLPSSAAGAADSSVIGTSISLASMAVKEDAMESSFATLKDVLQKLKLQLRKRVSQVKTVLETFFDVIPSDAFFLARVLSL